MVSEQEEIMKNTSDQSVEDTLSATALRLCEGLLKEFLTRPQMASLRVGAGNGTLAVVIVPDGDDYNLLYGKSGSMEKAMRTLLTQMALKWGASVWYEVRSEGGGNGSQYRYEERADWPAERIKECVRDMLQVLFEHPVSVNWFDELRRSKTHIELTLHQDESERVPLADLQRSLEVVVAAVGAANGRRIFLEKLERRQA